MENSAGGSGSYSGGCAAHVMEHQHAFEMNPLSVFVMGLAVVLVFAGIVLIVLAVAASASI